MADSEHINVSTRALRRIHYDRVWRLRKYERLSFRTIASRLGIKPYQAAQIYDEAYLDGEYLPQGTIAVG